MENRIELASSLVYAARARGLSLATAESLTAGMVSATIASIPGASMVLNGGAVTYTDTVKHRVLGVSEATLSTYTAVSRQTAYEMAQGARRLFGADIAVSLTGYAGPDGGSEDDPVGTVYLGRAMLQGVTVQRFVFSGSRDDVREAATCAALQLMIDACVQSS